MWTGGVRVVLPDEEGRILMVHQVHPERDIWLVPGGGTEDGELSREAAVREVMEETGLEIEIERMLWHVEQVKENGEQRFVDFFLGKITGGKLGLGTDPEFSKDEQVMTELAFMTIEEMAAMDNVYPEFLAGELAKLDKEAMKMPDPYRVRA